jgi:HlyD family secretion protein
MSSAAKPEPIRGVAKVMPIPAPVPKAPAQKARVRKWIFWAALIVLAAVGGKIWWSHAQNAIRFETVLVERGPIEANITATGTLNPVVNVQVGSQVSGNIKALYADFNTKVRAGQLVALIDPQMFQAQVDQASGAAASASAAVVTAGAQVEKVKADLAGAIASRNNLQSILAKDRANALNAQFQWERAAKLFEEGVLSQQDRDTAKAAYDASQAQITADQSQVDAAEHNIQSAQAQVNVATTQWSAARAQQRQAQAALAQAKINLQHTRILAPVSGTVIARHFDVGQTVAASFQAPDIFDIAQDLTQMQVDTNVDESDVGTIHVGQPASFTVDAYPGTTFRGSVTDVRKAPIVAQNVVTYDVVIQVSNPDLKLFPGMTANVSVLTEKQDDVLKVPNAALRFHPSADLLKKTGLTPAKGGAAQLYVLTGKQLKAVPVKLGISDGRSTAVTGTGLKPGDAIVVRATTPGTPSTSGPTPSTQRMPRM